MGIEKLWDRLDSETRQWFVDNPGCVILPRAVVAAISKATGAELDQDRHGETVLSPSDCDFIRSEAERHDALRSEASSPR
ncbi:hypothetical protein QF038_000826 [Pseudarthrobacter sp. W1I19]|uniref:hypothetical protein n=1 Tax=Pseudarthrobacter sp. W1I19 TaxID=3042288 RepID=UPI00278B3E7A|nr:hypothetical protein [Pseudarthrobacter sp. W1I19]MDQ0922318.1 hypothetical protein [Pseudarthrobacter sp. W1I19]